MTNHTTETAVRIRIGDKVIIVARGKRGRWTAEFWHHNQHHRRALKTANLKLARQRALLLEAELTTGQYTAPARSLAIAEAIKQFISNRRSEGKAPKTLVKYQGELDLFQEFLTTRGVNTLAEITATLFDSYRAQRAVNRSAKTVHVAMLVIKTFVRWCVGRELLVRDPLRSCKLKEPYTPPKRTPTTAQVQQILLDAHGQRRVEFALLAYSGLRAGEMQMLRPQDVDLEHGWIHVRAHDSWVPKTRQARSVPIHPKLREQLTTMPGTSRPFFFVAQASPEYPDGAHYIDIRTLNEELKRIAQSLGMPVGRKDDGFVVHSLRHYFETSAVDSGVPQFVVDAWMGHAGTAVMGKTYYGMSDEKSQSYMQRVKF